MLTGLRRSHSDRHLDELNEIIWNHAESNLGDTKADVLMIFDCCYAGDLGRARLPNSLLRSSEFIEATTAGTLTKIPGKSSFTSALIWALKKLANERIIFTTSELVREICNAPDFPKTQVPILAERNAASLSRIVLSRLSSEGDRGIPLQAGRSSDHHDSAKNTHYLQLNFCYDDRPADREIKHIAHGLVYLIKSQRVTTRCVLWGGLHSSSARTSTPIICTSDGAVSPNPSWDKLSLNWDTESINTLTDDKLIESSPKFPVVEDKGDFTSRIESQRRNFPPDESRDAVVFHFSTLSKCLRQFLLLRSYFFWEG
jgi:hypothetical protein